MICFEGVPWVCWLFD